MGLTFLKIVNKDLFFVAEKRIILIEFSS